MGLDITFLIDPMNLAKEILDRIFESVSTSAVTILRGVSSTLDGIISGAVDGIESGGLYGIIFGIVVISIIIATCLPLTV
ncbi:hypothetical protein [Apilactobacillus kunkeei]|nr:hypothetical protein [Apilactobacillus kunkeei]